MNAPAPHATPQSPAPAGRPPAAVDIDRGAAQLLVAMDAGRDAPVELAVIGADLATGLAVQDAITRSRLVRGDQAAGFKIGFTNRTIWPIYGVHAPIWGPVWQHTAHEAPAGQFDGTRLITTLNRPRLEPEIVFGLRGVPAAVALGPDGPTAQTIAELEGAIEWVAHGFELVQSPWPDWKFGAGQAMAAQGLHGALIVGPRRRVRQAAGLARALSALTLSLYRDSGADPIARGQGSDVLDGPVQALGHWLHASGQTPAPIAISDGLLVTTGTLTDAQPVKPGQRWRTALVDADGQLAACLDGPLADLAIHF